MSIEKELDHSALVALVQELREAVAGEVHGQIIIEESPAYESASNGMIESTIKVWQGQLRVMFDALIAKCAEKMKRSCCAPVAC